MTISSPIRRTLLSAKNAEISSVMAAFGLGFNFGLGGGGELALEDWLSRSNNGLPVG